MLSDGLLKVRDEVGAQLDTCPAGAAGGVSVARSTVT